VRRFHAEIIAMLVEFDGFVAHIIGRDLHLLAMATEEVGLGQWQSKTGVIVCVPWCLRQ
jgi:hypothetical protein